MGTPPVETYRRSNTAWRLHRKFGAHRGGAHNGTYARRIHGAILNLVCSLFCQGACGLGGQDWVGPHREVGRLVLGHTAQGVLVGGSRQVIIRTASNDASAGYLGQTPTQIVCGLNYPPLLDQGQGVVHASAFVWQKPGRACISSSTGRSHRRTKACNTTTIMAPSRICVDRVGFGWRVLLRRRRSGGAVRCFVVVWMKR